MATTIAEQLAQHRLLTETMRVIHHQAYLAGQAPQDVDAEGIPVLEWLAAERLNKAGGIL